MNHIILKQVLPQVFADMHDIQSEVWHQTITFSRGLAYLLEAESGKGKSSLLSFLFGYRKDYQGIILFDGNNICRTDEEQWTEIRKNQLDIVFQNLLLFDDLTAWENVQLKNRLTGYCTKEKIHHYFEALGLADKENQRVATLSFGQQQRVAFIRALCQPFDFLLMDEPVSHLDDVNANAMASILTEELAQRGAGLLVTSIGHRLEMNYTKTLKL